MEETFNLTPLELANKVGICRTSLDTYTGRFTDIWKKKKFVGRFVYYVGITKDDIEKLQNFANKKKRENKTVSWL